MLAARHRWLFSAAAPATASKPAATAPWFVVHRAAQLGGMALFSIGFLLPWTAFGHHSGGEGGGGSEGGGILEVSRRGEIMASGTRHVSACFLSFFRYVICDIEKFVLSDSQDFIVASL